METAATETTDPGMDDPPPSDPHENDPVPVRVVEPVDPNVDFAVRGEPNFVVELNRPATAEDVRDGCSAIYLVDDDLVLPIGTRTGRFRFEVTEEADSGGKIFNIRVKPIDPPRSSAVLFLVDVFNPVDRTSQVGLAYGRVLRS